jgi:branched-chain amino acid aminotransferase
MVWFDGELVPWSEARIHVATHALHYGGSVFEGLRVYPTPRGPALVKLGAHVRRLVHSCRIVGLPLPYDARALEKAIVDTVRANGLSSAYVRPIVFRGCGQLGVDPRACPVQVAVIVIEHGAHFGADALERGIAVGVSSYRRPAPDTLPALAKSAANYLNSQLILLEAKAAGFDDGLALDVDGFVAEGSGANVFLVQDGVLHTPPLESSILQGVTRGCLLELARELELPVVERRIPRELLATADEAFLCGTAAEVTPIRSIDRLEVGSGSRGPLTERLQREYAARVRGEREDRAGWLTLVG